MKNILVVCLLFCCFLSCRKERQHKSLLNQEKKSLVSESSKKQDYIQYFPNALIYQYEMNGEKNQLWFYVDETFERILYIPNDDMIDAVISYPNGDYEIYGTTEKGDKIILKQNISAVTSEEMYDTILKPLETSKIIDQSNIQQPAVVCKGYQFDYLKMKGSELLFATTQIPVNSYQIYGFSRLNGDVRITLGLDYINIFKKNDLITHINRSDFKLELLNFGPNPYEFSTKKYRFER
ncbi:conserved hypothetical protein [Flavobacterium sp. 9AF]|uniref:hypothetical protein n=1 Tax=Flavobacterium sp. 9AF TaxID=2653142 RepID=UPI0012F3B02C|nr:hypothetical protein [Flavobacterium sp. 9AF]VXB34085.1 conserved hypothetical protein [Flavobacterium sp. 9AF]